MNDLKECPFCGGEPKFEKLHQWVNGNIDGPVVRCSKCNASIELSYNEFDAVRTRCGNRYGYINPDTRDCIENRVVEKWNKREKNE